ncbi:MAG: hypothetical protein HFH34_06710 [Eubacterium sp.]|nr:hypothetical protein [Eubacterium sp.]
MSREEKINEILEKRRQLLTKQKDRLTQKLYLYVDRLEAKYMEKIGYLSLFFMGTRQQILYSFENEMVQIQQKMIHTIDEFMKDLKAGLSEMLPELGEEAGEYRFFRYANKDYFQIKYELNWYDILGSNDCNIEKYILRNIVKRETSFIRRSLDQYRRGFEAEFDQYLIQSSRFIEKSMQGFMMQSMALSQLIFQNPVRNAGKEICEQYLAYLKKYRRIGISSDFLYTEEQLNLYQDVLSKHKDEDHSENGLEQYAFFLLLDLMQLTGLEWGILESEEMQSALAQYLSDFPGMQAMKATIKLIVSAAAHRNGDWEKILSICAGRSREEIEYLNRIRTNSCFRHTKPFTIFVTATMSAGKSTLINAIAGKNLCLSQNLACTSKMHAMISKAFDDGVTYKYDHTLTLQTDEDTLKKNNEKNQSDEILVSAWYHGSLGGRRIVIQDSPGVNFSGDQDHKKLTRRLIRENQYDLLLFIMNATQLGTDDEQEHLRFVREHCGQIPILFVLNKIDTFQVEEESVDRTIQRMRNYLETNGFCNPVICPVSAKAGYLSKQSRTMQMDRSKRRELNNFIDKFEVMQLPSYYQKNFPGITVKEQEQEDLQLVNSCGLSYLEAVIDKRYKGGTF